jgi:drug/metabolite transporter (DMT)-like permease
MLSAVAMTLASLLERRAELLYPDRLLPWDQNLFYQGLGTAVVVTFPALLIEGLSTQWDFTFAVSLLWLILIVSIGAYALMWKLVKRLTATHVASLFYLGPPVTMVMAWLAFRDPVHATDIAGLSVVLAGILTTFTDRARRQG